MDNQLSLYANHIEFGIPENRLGNLICSLPLVWGRVDGKVQPCIYIKEITYPSFERISRKEALSCSV